MGEELTAKRKRTKLTAWLTSDGTENVLVAARSKTEAARLMDRSLYSFNQFASDLYDEHSLAVMALADPGTVFVCSNRGPDKHWRPRTPRTPTTQSMEAQS